MAPAVSASMLRRVGNPGLLGAATSLAAESSRRAVDQAGRGRSRTPAAT
ncbi:MAG: hypothetical protein ABIT36_11555 [Steroidobacteraceae bacterium]